MKYTVKVEANNDKELQTLKNVLKALKYSFSLSKTTTNEEKPYSAEFKEMIQQGEEDLRTGNYTETKNRKERNKLLRLDE